MDIKTIIEDDYKNLDAPISETLDKIFRGQDYPQVCCSTRMKQTGALDFDNIYVLAVTQTDIIEIECLYGRISFKVLYLKEIVDFELPDDQPKALPKLKIFGSNGSKIEYTFENREILYEFVYRFRRVMNKAIARA